jgi:hypothetical protein
VQSIKQMAFELSLEETLAALIDEIRRNVPDIDQWPDLNVSKALIGAMLDPANSVAKFQARLFEDPRFADLRIGWIEGQGYGSAIQDHMLPLVLIRAALREGDHARIIEEHREFAACRKSPLRNYFAIGGCSVDQAIQMAPCLRLVPWSDVPESRIKRKLSDQSSGGIAPPTDVIVQMRAEAGCAIEIDPKEDVQLLVAGEQQPEVPSKEFLQTSAGVLERHESARDVVRCIFLLTLVPTDIIGSWPEATGVAARRLFVEALSYGRALFELSMQRPTDVLVEGNAVKDRYLELARVEPGVREVLRHAIDRLNWATRRDGAIDRAIDLGIALEMLLLHGKGEKNELSFRLAIHGATFVGGSSSERQTNFAIFKRAYELRSQGVHSGRLKPKNVETASSDIDAGIKLAADVALKLLKLGRFPNWEVECLFRESTELS